MQRGKGLSHHFASEGGNAIPIIQMGRLRLREVESLSLGHMAEKRSSLACEIDP